MNDGEWIEIKIIDDSEDENEQYNKCLRTAPSLEFVTNPDEWLEIDLVDDDEDDMPCDAFVKVEVEDMDDDELIDYLRNVRCLTFKINFLCLHLYLLKRKISLETVRT